jgi:hypothetical protein
MKPPFLAADGVVRDDDRVRHVKRIVFARDAAGDAPVIEPRRARPAGRQDHVRLEAVRARRVNCAQVPRPYFAVRLRDRAQLTAAGAYGLPTIIRHIAREHVERNRHDRLAGRRVSRSRATAGGEKTRRNEEGGATVAHWRANEDHKREFAASRIESQRLSAPDAVQSRVADDGGARLPETTVIPSKAGIQTKPPPPRPTKLDSRFRGNDGRGAGQATLAFLFLLCSNLPMIFARPAYPAARARKRPLGRCGSPMASATFGTFRCAR